MNLKVHHPAKFRYVRVTLNLPHEVASEMAELPSGKRSAFAAEALRKAMKMKKLREALDRLQKRKPPINIERKKAKWRERPSW